LASRRGGGGGGGGGIENTGPEELLKKGGCREKNFEKGPKIKATRDLYQGRSLGG